METARQNGQTRQRRNGPKGAQRPVRRDMGRRQPEAAASGRERRRLWQMTVSAVIFLLVVAIKLTMPEVMEKYRQQVLTLMGENTDFVAAFSSVGQLVSPEGAVGGAINDAYTAVFGTARVVEEDAQKEPAEETPTEDQISPAQDPSQTPAQAQTAAGQQGAAPAAELPENVCMTQQVLGFPYTNPLDGTLTGAFGYREHPLDGGEEFHYGLDIAADTGAIISAFADGTVTAVGESSALGKYVILAHPDDYATLYAHCSRVTASSGQQVSAGAPIAEVGETGEVTGPHLHFELYQNNTYLNPIYYVAL